jgi:ech hydrogenase subunit E
VIANEERAVPSAEGARVSIGPYSPILPSVMKLDLDARPSGGWLGWSADVGDAHVGLGYNYVGLEERIGSGGVGWEESLALVEGLCGCCKEANVLAYVQAVESLGHLIVPPRAASLRLVLAETERITSHLLNCAHLLGAAGMPDAEMSLRDLREHVVYALAEWSGSRMPRGLVAFGGLTRNIDDVSTGAFSSTMRPIERALRSSVTALVNNRELAARLAGLGAVSGEEAIVAGLRGPVARGSGIAIDIRALFPTGAYEDEGVTIVTQRNGDAFSRLVVRLLECLESFRVIAQALEGMPTGSFRGRATVEMRESSGVGRAEGPRGEVFCWVRGGLDGPYALHLSGGSAPTAGVLSGLLRGAALDDLRVALISFDLCLPSVER